MRRRINGDGRPGDLMAAVRARESGKPQTRAGPGRSCKAADCLKVFSAASVWILDDLIRTCFMRRWKLAPAPVPVAKNKLREQLRRLRRPRQARHRSARRLRIQSDRAFGVQTIK